MLFQSWEMPKKFFIRSKWSKWLRSQIHPNLRQLFSELPVVLAENRYVFPRKKQAKLKWNSISSVSCLKQCHFIICSLGVSFMMNILQNSIMPGGKSKNYTRSEANQQGVLCAGAIQATMAFPSFVEVDGDVKSSQTENVLVTNKIRTVYSTTVLTLLKQASWENVPSILKWDAVGVVFMVLFPWQPPHIGTELPTGTLWSKGQALESDRIFDVLNVIPDSQFHWSCHVIIFNSQCQCQCSLYTHKII